MIKEFGFVRLSGKQLVPQLRQTCEHFCQCSIKNGVMLNLIKLAFRWCQCRILSREPIRSNDHITSAGVEKGNESRKLALRFFGLFSKSGS